MSEKLWFTTFVLVFLGLGWSFYSYFDKAREDAELQAEISAQVSKANAALDVKLNYILLTTDDNVPCYSIVSSEGLVRATGSQSDSTRGLVTNAERSLRWQAKDKGSNAVIDMNLDIDSSHSRGGLFGRSTSLFSILASGTAVTIEPDVDANPSCADALASDLGDGA